MALSLIVLPPDVVSKCRKFGEDLVAQYSRGESPNSRAYSSHGAERNIDLQTQAKAAECAFAIWLGVEINSLHWSRGPDLGADVEMRGFQFDVKRSHEHSQWLIWPVAKNQIFGAKRFNTLVLARGTTPKFEINGWIRKHEFFKHKQTAPAGHKLTEGTWYIDKDLLCPMDGLRFQLDQHDAA
jgi:hypothetical protein